MYRRLKKVEEKFKLCIRVYKPSEDGTWRFISQPAHYEAVGTQPMIIGFYNNHAFLIKDIKKLALMPVGIVISSSLELGNFNGMQIVVQKVKQRSAALEK